MVPVERDGLGEVLIEAGFVIDREGPIVRAPDVAFLSRGRSESADLDGWFEGAPDLAVEIVSPSDSAQDLHRKIGQYLAAGSRAVLAVYPLSREVLIHCSDHTIRALGPGGRARTPRDVPRLVGPRRRAFLALGYMPGSRISRLRQQYQLATEANGRHGRANRSDSSRLGKSARP